MINFTQILHCKKRPFFFFIFFLFLGSQINAQVVTTWGSLSGTVPENNFQTSSLSSIGDGVTIVTVDITRSSSSSVGGAVNAVAPSSTLANSFNNARTTVGVSGNTYTYTFSEPVHVILSSQEHSNLIRTENIKISSPDVGALFSGSLTNPQEGHFISNNNTSEIHIGSKSTITTAGTYWTVESNIAITTLSVEYYTTDATEAASGEPFTMDLSPNPWLRLDTTNVTGAGGIDINSTACSTGWEPLDNTNTGATSDLVAPHGIQSMTVTLTNEQDIGQEELTMTGGFTGILVSGNNTTSLTITNDGNATISEFRQVLDDIFYLNNLVNPTTGVNRLIDIQITDFYGGTSNIATGSFPITRGPRSGSTNGQLIIFVGDGPTDLFTGLDGTEDAGGTWVDVNATGALAGSIVDEATLPLGGSIFRYDVTGPSPCSNASTTVVVIKMSNTEIALTSPSACGELVTAYANPLQSANSDDPIFVFDSGSGELVCPAGSAGTIYDWYIFNPTSNSYDAFALGSTPVQTGLADGGYLIVRNDGGTVEEGRAWIWNSSLVMDAGAPQNACSGDTVNLAGAGTVTNPVYTYYDPVPRPFPITATTEISVTFDATHTYVSDLGFFAVAPDGNTTVTLGPNQGNTCNSGDNVTNLTFTNDAVGSVFNFCAQPAPLTGTHDQYFDGTGTFAIDWSPFIGFDARTGGWAVQIYDCVGADTGTLDGATIIFDDGLGNVVTYTSGSISVGISDNSCTPASASIYVVPFTPATPGVDNSISLSDGIGVGGAGGYEWSYSTTGPAGPWSGAFENSTLTPSRIVNETTWFRIVGDNGVSCATEDIVQITVNDPPNSGTGTDEFACAGDTVVNLNSLITGADVGGIWSVSGSSPDNPGGDFNAGAATYDPATGGIYTFDYTVAATAPCVSNAITSVTVSVQASPNSGINNTINATIGDGTINLLSNLLGTPEPFGIWSLNGASDNPGGSFDSSSGTVDTNTLTDGTYIFDYSLTSCTTSTSSLTIIFTTLDTDNDGIGNLADIDDDNDGILDTVENTLGVNPSIDADNDGIPNYQDFDNNGSGTAPVCIDGNLDGICDTLDPVFDFDGDGVPNHLDLDSDNDGITDLVESGQLDNGAVDANQDGIIDGVPADFGSNGLANTIESNDTAAATTANPTSTDTDGNANYVDIDADNDGIVDNIEGQSTSGYLPPSGNDTDNDGIDDQYDANCTIATCGLNGTPITPENTDGLADGADYIDLDSDEDTESDTIEAYDSNDDGVVDATDTIGTTPDLGLLGTDSDGDGLDDEFDTDGASTTDAGGSNNGGQTAINPFPDTDSPGGEPDWRESINNDFEITKVDTYVDTNGNGIIDAGDTINYTFIVTNNGTATLTTISVTESDPNVIVSGGPIASLAPSAVDNSTFSATYTILTADITAGTYSNTATVNAGDPNGNLITSLSDDPDDPANATDNDNDGNPDDPTVTDLRQPLLDITKTSTGVVDTNGNGIIDAGDTINYTFVVTNTGNIDLTGISVTDANATVVPATTIDLIVGAVDNSTYTASYIITAGDITTGNFTNTAVASAPNPLGGAAVTDNSDDPNNATNVDPNNDGSPDDPTVTDLRQPLLDITKTSTGVVDTNGNGIIDAGDTINYTFIVTNTGNIDLTGISVTDANATVVPATTIDLVVGAVDNSTYTASYIITAGDITAGTFNNQAVVSALNPLNPLGPPVTDNSDDPNDATNVDPDNDGSPDDVTTTDLRQPLLDITKTSTGVVDTNGNGIIDAGDTINYTFVVTNTGNIDLTGISVTDANATVVPATTIDLIVGAVDNSTYTASYIITAGDITTGNFTNTAVASAPNPLGGAAVTDNSDDPNNATNVDPNNDGSPDDPTVTDLRQPLLDITKTSTGVVDTNGNGIIDAGDTINYTFIVTNTGNIDLTGISVTDANATVVPATTIDLVVGAVDNSTYTASYIITAGDITAGTFNNQAVVSALNPLNPLGPPVTDNSDDPNDATNVDPDNDGSPDDVTTTDLRQPLLDITKTSTGVVDTNGNGIIDAGDTINYTFVVTNTGNIDLTGISVTDANATVVPATTIDLIVGAVDNSTYTASYIITAGDITTGNFTNTAVASAPNPLGGAAVTDNSDDPNNATNVDPNNDGSPDDPTVTDLRQPLLDITKTSTGVVDTNGNGIIDAGDTINYTFIVTNTGNIDLTGISVTDANATVVPATTIDLVVGAVDNSTYTASYIITAGDITAGTFNNQAVVSALNPLNPLGPPVTDNSDDPNDATNVDPDNDGSPDDVTTTDLRQPLLDITKTSTGVVDTNGNGIIDAGDTINYTFVVTNTGNIDLTGISVTDANATVVPATTIDLVVGAVDNSTYTASHVITAGDITAGTFNNQAVASAPNPLGGAAVTDNSDDPNNATNVDPNNDGSPDDPTVTDLRQPLLDITKTSTGVVDTNGNGIIDAGDTINYTFIVTNTGNIDLTGISVTDANATVVPATTIDLVVGAVDNSTYTASYIITAGDITAGTFNNQAVVSALNPLNPLGPPVTDNSDDPNDATNVDPDNDGSPDDVTTTDLRQPLLDITKTSTGVVDTNGNGIIDAGDTINYTFVVTNTGNIDLTGISVTDANATVVPATTIDLVVGAVDNSTYTASHVITAGDITAGTFNNQAVASAPNPLGGAAVTDNSDDPNNATNVDPNNDGSPDDPTVTDLRQPLLDITKTSTGVVDTNGNGIIDAGDTINYTFIVTNTGNIDLTGISVTDANATVVPATTIDLVVGAVDNSTYTASYIITAGDITAGTFNNQAVVSALNPLNPLGPPVTDNSDDPNDATNVDPDNDGSPDDVTTTDLRQPLLDITKTSTGVVDTNGNGIIDAGDTINYTFIVTNTGNIDLTGISVTDANATVVPATTIDLIVGAVDNSTYTASYIITAGDITTGNFTNTAVASAPNPLGGAAVTDNSDDPNNATNVDPNNDGSPDDPTVTDLRQPLLDITKTGTLDDANLNGFADVGENINYTFVVTNRGNVDLTGISVTDANATVVPATTIDLIAGAVDNSTYTAVHTLTQAEINSGSYINQAVASAPNPLGGVAVTDNSDDPNDATNVDPNNDGSPDDVTVITLTPNPVISITKADNLPADGSYNTVGEAIIYTLEITNSGNVTLTNVVLTDPNADTITPGVIASIDPGQTVITTATHVITQADIDLGTVTNTASVTAEDPNTTPVNDDSDDPDTPAPDDATITIIDQNPELTLTKISNAPADGAYDTVGEVITYTLEVINTGTVTINNITVTDLNADAGSITPANIVTIAPGDRVTVTAAHTITQLDLDAGIVINRADVVGETPGGTPVTDTSDDPTTPDPNDATETETGLVTIGRLSVTKSADLRVFTAIGDVITYTIEIENTGTVTLSNIIVNDANATIISGLPISTLTPGTTVTIVAEHVVTLADILEGQVVNVAEVTGVTPTSETITETSDDPNNSDDNDPDLDGDPDDPTISVIDSDSDGIPDPDDMDDDNDGITDIEEQNGDPNLDTDGDGIIDRLDLDADGDGVLDVYESGADLDGLSISNIGRIEGTVGTDGIPDGVQDVREFDSGNVNYPIQDTDGDGRDDFQDIDDDDDDILTVDENPDPNGDGNPDDAFDTDGNGTPDYLEPNGSTGEGEDGITVFTGMSPNGDGVNDVFIISGIERLENTLEIYNRWGVKVYGAKNYGRNDNFFRGISNGRTTIEGTDQLPVGTYYYVLEYVLESGERKSRAGYIYINR
ncbi:gliding motility-associated C-terminal domain-containing protein [Aquimarina sp. Aq78]|uniref:gliding motility-associated C-terminal domain-containing protein n=2 Tax=Aquimarina sp. Aq78 TaxID=1191889 RepID=UPI0020C35640|nr:gliding motility-associated C-terminal domain-containing protein [Aquimarina sp. Aq78]